MPLSVVAVPIGHAGDITLRALETLRSADVVIGEERREVSKLLKTLGIENKSIELLNEHSTENDVNQLLELVRNNNVALVSDCGTPGFCDPGARLVAACRREGLTATPIPGASSLMCLLAIAGRELREFLFRGFLPAEREARNAALSELDRERRPFILMDTPYRLGRLLEELAERWPNRMAVLGCDFTQETETILEAPLKELPKLVGSRKAEFVIAVFPSERTEQPRSDRRDSRKTGRRNDNFNKRASSARYNESRRPNRKDRGN